MVVASRSRSVVTALRPAILGDGGDDCLVAVVGERRVRRSREDQPLQDYQSCSDARDNRLRREHPACPELGHFEYVGFDDLLRQLPTKKRRALLLICNRRSLTQTHDRCEGLALSRPRGASPIHDEHRQSIESFTHVGRPTSDPDLGARRSLDHRPCSSSTSAKRAIYDGATLSGAHSTQPLQSTISIRNGASSAVHTRRRSGRHPLTDAYEFVASEW